MIIALSGYAQSGKDSAARTLIEDFNFHRYAFADRLREVLYALNPQVYAGDEGFNFGGCIPLQELVDMEGWDVAKTEYTDVRRLLRAMGTEAGRKILGEDVWVNATFNLIVTDSAPVVITDCRFPNEAQRVKDHGGYVVRIRRNGVGPANDHPSETSLDDWPFDFSLNNNGTIEDLSKAVHGLVRGVNLFESGDVPRPNNPLPAYGSPVANNF